MNNVVDMFNRTPEPTPASVDAESGVALSYDQINHIQWLVNEMVNESDAEEFAEKMREVSAEVSAWPDG